MSHIAIQVEGLGKRYRIGGKKERYRTLRDTLTAVATAPVRRFRSLLRGESAVTSNEMIWALRDVTFEVQYGEVLGIIGRNGAGKSTLLKILSRITKPTVGGVDIYGRVGSLLEVGTGFHPELTGRENIYLNGAILGMRRTEINRKFDEIVAFAEIDQFIDTPAKHYSSGMYMRLAFSVAAHLEPEILLVDEVLAVGDVAFQKKCLGKMGEVAQEGRTVLFVSHNLVVVKQLCQRGILLHGGKIAQQGTINEVIQTYIGGAAHSADCVEVSAQDHTTGLNGIQVRQIKLLNSVSELFAVPWKEPIQLSLDIEVTKAMRYVNFGIGLTTLDGMPIFTTHSGDGNTGRETETLAPGRYQVKITLENPLRLGTYNLLVGAHEGIGKTSIFFIPDAVRLEVVLPQEGGLPYIDYNSGLVNCDSQWNIAPSGSL